MESALIMASDFRKALYKTLVIIIICFYKHCQNKEQLSVIKNMNVYILYLDIFPCHQMAYLLVEL